MAAVHPQPHCYLRCWAAEPFHHTATHLASISPTGHIGPSSPSGLIWVGPESPASFAQTPPYSHCAYSFCPAAHPSLEDCLDRLCSSKTSVRSSPRSAHTPTDPSCRNETSAQTAPPAASVRFPLLAPGSASPHDPAGHPGRSGPS